MDLEEVIIMFRQKLAEIDYGRIAKNILVFSAPALVVFFAQLQQGVSLKNATLVALLVIYGILADFFRKFKEVK